MMKWASTSRCPPITLTWWLSLGLGGRQPGKH